MKRFLSLFVLSALTLSASSATAQAPAYQWVGIYQNGISAITFQHPRGGNLQDCHALAQAAGHGDCEQVRPDDQYRQGYRVFGNGMVWADTTATTNGSYNDSFAQATCHNFRKFYKSRYRGEFACVKY